MKNTPTDVINSILDAVQYLIDKAISKAPFDKTKQGTVMASLGNNLYTVKVDGVDYSIPSSLSIVTYSVNDIVLVTYFQNKIDNAYITGKVVKR